MELPVPHSPGVRESDKGGPPPRAGQASIPSVDVLTPTVDGECVEGYAPPIMQGRSRLTSRHAVLVLAAASAAIWTVLTVFSFLVNPRDILPWYHVGWVVSLSTSLAMLRYSRVGSQREM